MSSKSNPIGFRIKKNIKLDSQWYSHHNYSEILHDDLKIREIIQNFLLSRNIITNQIIIKRTKKRLLIFIYIYDTFYNAKKFCINKEIQKIIKNYTNIFEQKISLYLYNYSKIYTFDKPVVKNLILSYSYLKKKKNYKDLISLAYIALKTQNVTGFVQLLAKILKYKQNQSRLIKHSLKIFNTLRNESDSFIGIKINFKGRIKGRNRAKKIYRKHGQLPLQTTQATIAYSQTTTFSRYGTFGLKLWLSFFKPLKTDLIKSKITFLNNKLTKQLKVFSIKTTYEYEKNFIIWYFLYKYSCQFDNQINFKKYLTILSHIKLHKKYNYKHFIIPKQTIKIVILKMLLQEKHNVTFKKTPIVLEKSKKGVFKKNWKSFK